jgi:hypothetical protein
MDASWLYQPDAIARRGQSRKSNKSWKSGKSQCMDRAAAYNGEVLPGIAQ